jgi:hypothetical protein
MFRFIGETLQGLAEWRFGKLLARLLWLGTGVMTRSRFDDPLYKKNLQRLIERNRKFEETRNEPHS